MAAAFKDTPLYHDELIQWHNQRLWWGLIVMTALLSIALVSIIVLVLRKQPPPYVIAVNSQGEPVGMLQPLPGSGPIADETIRYAISQWVEDAFRIDPDVNAEAMWLTKAYAMLPAKSQAYSALTDWYNTTKANNPLTQGKDWQEVHVTRTLRLPDPYTYQVDYELTRHGSQSKVVSRWQAIMRVQQSHPTSGNLLGVFITSLDFEAEK